MRRRAGELFSFAALPSLPGIAASCRLAEPENSFFSAWIFA